MRVRYTVHISSRVELAVAFFRNVTLHCTVIKYSSGRNALLQINKQSINTNGEVAEKLITSSTTAHGGWAHAESRGEHAPGPGALEGGLESTKRFPSLARQTDNASFPALAKTLLDLVWHFLHHQL